MTEQRTEARKAEHDADVLAHIAAHEAKGDTEAVKKHMAAPAHKAIVEQAARAKQAKPAESVPTKDK